MPLIIDELIRAVRSASVFNAQIQVPPACILWPDKERQWEAIVPRLQEQMPELCVLGKYDAAARRGPAIWLRAALVGHCMEKADPAFAEAVEEAQAFVSGGMGEREYGSKQNPPVSPSPPPPIIYLPGVGRQDLRAVESCPEELKPLAELQYRGCIWSQINAKDWSILAFLKTDQGGLDLDVAQDAEARRRVKEQQKRIGAAEFRNTHFSYILGLEGVEKFVSTPELRSENSIGDDPLEPGQVWAISPGASDGEHPGLYRLETNVGPGSGVKILPSSYGFNTATVDSMTITSFLCPVPFGSVQLN